MADKSRKDILIRPILHCFILIFSNFISHQRANLKHLPIFFKKKHYLFGHLRNSLSSHPNYTLTILVTTPNSPKYVNQETTFREYSQSKS